MSAAITTDSASPSGAPSAQPETSLATEVRSTYAKLKGMQELDAQALFSRDSKRLDSKARAIYERLGLKLKDTPGDLQMIADDITLDEAARSDIFKRLDDAEMGDVRIVADNITFEGGSSKPAEQPVPDTAAASEPEVATPAPALAAPTETKASLIAPAVATAALLASGIGIPVSYYFGQRASQTNAVAPQMTDTNTRGVLELVPEEGQRPSL